MGWCEYDPKEEMKNSANNNRPDKRIKVRCNETGEIFETISDAANWCGISVSGISIYLSGKSNRKSAGKHPDNGEKLTWSLVK